MKHKRRFLVARGRGRGEGRWRKVQKGKEVYRTVH